MNILVVQDGTWLKKGPHTQHHLMEKLTVKGHKVKVIGFNQLWKEDLGGFISPSCVYSDVRRFYKNSSIDYISPAFVRIPLLDYFSYFFTVRYEIQSTINKFRPHVIVSFTNVLSSYWGMYYAKRYNIPFVYYWTDITHELIPFKPLRPIAQFIEKLVLMNSDEVVATNENLKRYISTLGVNLDSIVIFPNGVDLTTYNPSIIDSSSVKKMYHFSDNDRILFFMGWIYEFSGLQEVIMELKDSIHSYPHIKLLIVGKGEYFENLQNLVRSYNLEENVILTGERPYKEIPSLIAASTICLLPAHNIKIMRDIVPIKMYEYLAMNKTVISTKLPGVMEEFGFDNGVIYVDRPEDVIKKAISLDETELAINSDKSKKFISKYSWENITSEFELFLQSLYIVER